MCGFADSVGGVRNSALLTLTTTTTMTYPDFADWTGEISFPSLNLVELVMGMGGTMHPRLLAPHPKEADM
jgi:hypothetical protein